MVIDETRIQWKKNTISSPQFNHCAYFISVMLVHSGLNMVHEVAMTMWWAKNTHTHTHDLICGEQMTQFHMCEEEERSIWISLIYALSQLWVAMKLKLKEQRILYVTTFEWWILKFPWKICDHHSGGEWSGDTLFEI